MDLKAIAALPQTGTDAARQQRAVRDLDVKNLGTHPDKRAALRRAAKELESVFAYQMVSAMRKTVSWGDGGLIKKSSGEKVFQGMLDEQWAKKMTEQTGPRSLSETIYRQMSQKLGWDEPAPEAAAAAGAQWRELERTAPAFMQLNESEAMRRLQ